MTQKPENPPAFPLSYPRPLGANNGMTLRDYFAVQALVGSLNIAAQKTSYDSVCAESDKLAKRCYDFADAMLEARQK